MPEMNVPYALAGLPMPELNKCVAENTKCVAESVASNTKTTRQQHENNTQQHENYCPNCGSVEIKKSGKTLANRQRWACKACGKTFVE